MNGRRISIIILLILSILFIGGAAFLAYQLQQQQAGQQTTDLPAGAVCTPNGEVECLSGFCCQCSSGNFCLDPAYGDCNNYCESISGDTTGGPTGSNQKGEGEICSPGLSECILPLVCRQTMADSGEYKCVDPGDQSMCSAEMAVCGNSDGYFSYVCASLDENGACTMNKQTHSTFADAAARVQNEGGCGQIEEVWVGGSCDGTLCGDSQVIIMGCTTDTTTDGPPVDGTTDDGTTDGSPTVDGEPDGTTASDGPPVSNSTTTSDTSSTGPTTDGSLPDTALFDNNNFVLIVGLLLVIGGIALNRLDFMQSFNKNIQFDAADVAADLGSRFMTYEEKVIHDREKRGNRKSKLPVNAE